MAKIEEMLLPTINAAMSIKGVKVNREEFLRKELHGKVAPDIIERAISYGTKNAGIPFEIIDKLADNCISSRSSLAVTESFLSGLPGGLVGLLGGSAVDIIQFYANFLNLAQKLMYLYGFRDIKELDSSQEDIMVVMLGAASGVEIANKYVKILLSKSASKWLEKIAAEEAGKSAVKILAEKVLIAFGKKSTARITQSQLARIFSKAVPFIGGAICGTITAFTFKPMARRLNKSLADGYTTEVSIIKIS